MGADAATLVPGRARVLLGPLAGAEVRVGARAGLVVEAKWLSPRRARSTSAREAADDCVKYQYSEQLTAAHAGKTQLILVPGADHGDAHGPPRTLTFPVYRQDIADFLGL